MSRRYACIECGHPAPELYKDFQGGIIKISHCEKCYGLIDKYIEFDLVIVCLDAVLHKPQTYRHLLFNSNSSAAWKLVMIFLLCDTYVKWAAKRITLSGALATEENRLFYAAFESEIYSVFVVVFFEWLLLCGCVALMVNLMQRFSLCNSYPPIELKPFSKANFIFIHRVLALSSFSKLLAIPAFIWGQTMYLPITKLLAFTSNLTALKVVYDMNQLVLLPVLLTGHLVQYLAGDAMMTYLYG